MSDVAPKAPARKTKPSAPVVFESREPEPIGFDVARISPIRNFGNGRLEWEVPAEDLERFSAHYHVVTGRLVRKHVD
jgi:hypothetical protein